MRKMGTAVQRAKCSVFIATSLDGFISRLDGSIDWLDKANKDITPGEDCGFREFMSTVDVMVMGRNTYEQVRTMDPWLYGTTPITVITSRPESFNTTEERDTISVSGDSPEAIVERLTAQGKRHVYVDGGLTIQSFLAADLIDELIITTIPVLLGTGRPLFGGGACVRDIPLAHVATRAFDFGFVQSKYRVRREGEEDST